MRFILLMLLLPVCLFSRAKTRFNQVSEDLYEPWFTGPLLAPTPVNMEPGHPAIEPILIVSNNYGEYDSDWKLKTHDSIWEINPLVDFQFGITERTGIEIFTGFISKFQNDKSTTQFQDTVLLFGYQVLEDEKGTWIPNFRIDLTVSFPSGKHDRLNPKLNGLDITSDGAYFIGPTLAFQKHIYLPKNYLSLQWSAAYFFPTRAKLRGLNAYGGTANTKGSIRPGQDLICFFSGEYSFNQHWVFAFDTAFRYDRRSKSFKGRPGLLPDGSPAPIGLPSAFRMSFAPELEYNFSADSGLLFGAWFSLFGKNSDAFASLFIAYVYVF